MEKEIFRDIIGYEGLYQISNLGRVKSLARKKLNGRFYFMAKEMLLKPAKDRGGYLWVYLCKNGRRENSPISRLVGKAFIPNSNNLPQINHKKGIKIDNRATELEWCTRSENMKHSFKNNLHKSGEKHGRSKLNELQVRVIKHWKNINSKITLKEIAKVFRINMSTVNRIYLGKTWQHVTI